MIDGTDEMVERAAAELRAPVHLDATFDDRVMRAIRTEDAPAARRPGAWQWLMRPRPFEISPLAGLAYAAVLVVVVGTLASRASAPAPIGGVSSTAVAPETVSDSIVVTFMLRAPAASRVTVVGDFNDWSPSATPLKRVEGDLWSVTLPLVRGRYTYNFVLDDRDWVTDPSAPRAVGDDFGRPSSVVMVAGT